MPRPLTHGIQRPPTLDSLEPPRPRGRPRSTGDKKCDRCGRYVAKIRVHWPEGAICGICFTDAVHTYGRCAQCDDERLLPGRANDGSEICRDCASITHPEMTCIQCGAEAERFRGGWCVRCVIEGDLNIVLKPASPPDFRVKKLIAVLVDSRRPETIYTWMLGKKTKELLTLIGNRELELSHAELDALPRSTAVDHLREILVHNGLLVAPADRYLAIFERWLTQRLQELAPHPEIAIMIEQFATWHHLKRLRSKVGTANMDIACRNARQEITEAGKFLLWIETDQLLKPDAFTQVHIDTYLNAGTSTRKTIKNFISWYSRGRGGKRRFYVPPRYPRTLPTLSQSRRLHIIRNAIEFDNVALATRIAALIHLLWATPISRIVQLKIDQIMLEPDGMMIALGSTATEVPEFIAPLFWQHLSARGNQQTTNTHTDWLFPGYRAGQHLTAPTLQQRFRLLGLDPQRTRNASLKNLTGQIDVHSLADTLGY